MEKGVCLLNQQIICSVFEATCETNRNALLTFLFAPSDGDRSLADALVLAMQQVTTTTTTIDFSHR